MVYQLRQWQLLRQINPLISVTWDNSLFLQDFHKTSKMSVHVMWKHCSRQYFGNLGPVCHLALPSLTWASEVTVLICIKPAEGEKPWIRAQGLYHHRSHSISWDLVYPSPPREAEKCRPSVGPRGRGRRFGKQPVCVINGNIPFMVLCGLRLAYGVSLLFQRDSIPKRSGK